MSEEDLQISQMLETAAGHWNQCTLRIKPELETRAGAHFLRLAMAGTDGMSSNNDAL